MVDEKNEAEILFPGVRIGDVLVKPWSLNQFVDAIPIIIGAYEILKAENIDFQKIGVIAEEKNLSEILLMVGRAIPKLKGSIIGIVSITIDLEEGKIGGMDFDKVFSIALLSIIQNAERIKNFSGLGRIAMQSMTAQG